MSFIPNHKSKSMTDKKWTCLFTNKQMPFLIPWMPHKTSEHFARVQTHHSSPGLEHWRCNQHRGSRPQLPPTNFSPSFSLVFHQKTATSQLWKGLKTPVVLSPRLSSSAAQFQYGRRACFTYVLASRSPLHSAPVQGNLHVSRGIFPDQALGIKIAF